MEKITRFQKSYRKHRESRKKATRDYIRRTGGKSQKQYLRNTRIAVLGALGNKCSKCEFADPRALQIDHVNGGGSVERKSKGFKGTFNKHVLRSFLNGEGRYQLLCANCNWIKRFENKEVKK